MEGVCDVLLELFGGGVVCEVLLELLGGGGVCDVLLELMYSTDELLDIEDELLDPIGSADELLVLEGWPVVLLEVAGLFQDEELVMKCLQELCWETRGLPLWKCAMVSI